MLTYYLVYPILYLLSLLPMRVLYGVSTVFRFVLFDCIGYRKKVVERNMRKAFPEKSEAELQQLANLFYAYFCDLVGEIVTSLSISYTELQKRFHLGPDGLSLLHGCAEKGQSILLAINRKRGASRRGRL